MENVDEIVRVEFEMWMADVAKYHELSPATQARIDEYIAAEYARHWDSLRAAPDA